MGKIIYMDDNETRTETVLSSLAIPKNFVASHKIRRALYAIIYDFSIEEQKAILLHYWIGFTIEEISALTDISPLYIVCVLVLYSERLRLKLDTYNADVKEMVRVEELFEAELWKQYEAYLQECERDTEYKTRFAQMKDAFSETFFHKLAGDALS